MNGVDMLLGNDLVKGDTIGVPIVGIEPVKRGGCMCEYNIRREYG